MEMGVVDMNMHAKYDNYTSFSQYPLSKIASQSLLTLPKLVVKQIKKFGFQTCLKSIDLYNILTSFQHQTLTTVYLLQHLHP